MCSTCPLNETSNSCAYNSRRYAYKQIFPPLAISIRQKKDRLKIFLFADLQRQLLGLTDLNVCLG